MRSAIKTFGRLVALLLVLWIANVILVGGQKLWHRKDNARLKEIKTVLASKRTAIRDAESDLRDLTQALEHSESDLAAMKSRVKSFEKACRPRTLEQTVSELVSMFGRLHNTGTQSRGNQRERSRKIIDSRQESDTRFLDDIPTPKRAAYSDMLGQYNRCIALYNWDLSRYNKRCAEYSRQVDGYNALVRAADDLTTKVGSAWYDTPVPRGAGGRGFSRVR